MADRISGLERDDKGEPLPTLRNKEIFDKLIKEYGSKEMLMLKQEDDYGPYVRAVIMEPLPGTKKEKEQVEAKYKMIEELDKEYLKEISSPAKLNKKSMQ